MSGGGKGGKSTTEVKIPPELKEAAVRNLDRAEKIGSIGYMPYRGPSVAAQTPRQLDAMKNTNLAARAFGMAGGGTNPMQGMPPVQTVGGVRGYSADPLYDNAIGGIPKGQMDALSSFFINPMTGAKGKGGELPKKGRNVTPPVPTPSGRTAGGYKSASNPYGYDPFQDDH